MQLGTPLSASATRLLMLGAGELGKELLIAAQRLGVETIAVDRYADAPAMQVAHRSHVLDMTDPEAILAVVKHERPHYVVPEIEAIATSALAEIEATGLATVVPSARAVQLTMDREGIRRLAAEELGLPTSPYRFAGTLAELEDAAAALGFPCVIKPVMSSSGKGQSVVRGAAELALAWQEAQTAGRVGGQRIIVEGFVDFDFEITLLTVRSAFGTIFCAPVGHRQEAGDYVESWQPQPMSDTALREAEKMAQRVTDNLGGRGLYGVEFFVRGTEVIFSELSPRPHDTGLVTLASQRQSEFDLHLRAILGLPVEPGFRRPAASAVVRGKGLGWGPVYSGLEAALAVPESDLRLFGKPTASKLRRLGVGIACADNVEEARERARRIAAAVGLSPAPERG
ncbi:formate-dependent phosphoribosylglycinamide formyltransferase [Acidithiobacillus sp. 'AMD consortium']|uniref:Formate-dependent phosphoribosylglycinamide formyltransferase n=3 Tax=Acidithiobacillaceae TaxID=225058 RepID=A0A8X8GEV4_ACIFI|nr:MULTISPECIES: formate-dependent phosphoribosylglycinamide formyltransferase [Acidithiobacillus]MBU2715617.1 formate-dependent phosphoribosylglycinamide formyltransferase [Acidithiobacillus ferridurans]MBU2724516.1 formate-dependent phosphoribosylglycinamide formyltransferase [Acidithiobacillus ferridurans]MBU2728215.1 formate-dependent phosphoribosylglycinamide formyltransferase [Acidithiobacillus ferridurans]MBU2804374.1 formate-dependent phosphoribosylglycinamide formyltransferase [Acidith